MRHAVKLTYWTDISFFFALEETDVIASECYIEELHSALAVHVEFAKSTWTSSTDHTIHIAIGWLWRVFVCSFFFPLSRVAESLSFCVVSSVELSVVEGCGGKLKTVLNVTPSFLFHGIKINYSLSLRKMPLYLSI